MESNFVIFSLTAGNIIAIIISWSLNKSVFWAIIHGICSWLYIIYYLIGNPKHDNLTD